MMVNPVVLVVGDLADFQRPLRDRGFDVLCCSNTTEARTVLDTNPAVDAIVTDVSVPKSDTESLLDFSDKLSLEVGVVVIVPSGDVAGGVELVGRGAADFLQDPPSIDELRVRLHQFVSHRNVRRENLFLTEQARRSSTLTSQLDLRQATHAFERRHILEVLTREDGNRARTARALGIGLSSLYRKLDELDIRKTDNAASQRP